MIGLNQKHYRHAWNAFIPVSAAIEITVKCNLRCSHCYNFDRLDTVKQKAQGKEIMPREKVLSVIDELAEAGTLSLAFTGGECLLHPDLEEFVRHARAKKFAVRIKTNGTLLTEARVDALVKAGVNDMDVSLYGGIPATHDALTNIPGSFLRTIAGIRHAREQGIFISVSFVLHKGSAGEITEMLAIANDLDVRPAFSTEISHRHDGTTTSKEHEMSPEQFRAILTGPHKEIFQFENHSNSVQCACARTTVGVSARGEVFPCIGAPVFAGSLYQDSFQNIWQKSEVFQNIRGLSLKDFSSCSGCDARKFCSRSSGQAYTDTGNYTGAYPSACVQAEVRKELSSS